jgi:putative oxidoreductase
MRQASRELNAMPAGGHTVIRLPRAAVWACAIFLAMVFVLAGISKLEGASAMRWTERFAQWGYPATAQYLIGVLEILGGLGVLIPRWRRAAAAILVALMIGALCTHVVQREFPRLIPPLVLGGLAFLLYSSCLRPGGQTSDPR